MSNLNINLNKLIYAQTIDLFYSKKEFSCNAVLFNDLFQFY